MGIYEGDQTSPLPKYLLGGALICLRNALATRIIRKNFIQIVDANSVSEHPAVWGGR